MGKSAPLMNRHVYSPTMGTFGNTRRISESVSDACEEKEKDTEVRSARTLTPVGL